MPWEKETTGGCEKCGEGGEVKFTLTLSSHITLTVKQTPAGNWWIHLIHTAGGHSQSLGPPLNQARDFAIAKTAAALEALKKEPDYEPS